MRPAPFPFWGRAFGFPGKMLWALAVGAGSEYNNRITEKPPWEREADTMARTKRPGSQERIERRISAAGRLTLCVLLLLLQIFTTLALSALLQQRASYVYGALELMGAGFAIWIYSRSGSPSYKLSWMCLLLLVPVAGVILFCLWGGLHQAKDLSLKMVTMPPERGAIVQASEANFARLNRELPNWGRVAAYLQKRGFWLYRNTHAHYLPDGAAFFDDLIEHLAKAETYIFLEYYILAEGEIWDRIFAVLRERAAAGVEVKIIFDDFGNITRLSDPMLQAIQNCGIELEVFNPVHKYVNRLYFNYRDHRKITVIDGHWAYTGGINIGDEYANRIRRFGHWKDSGVRIEGDAAWSFTLQFIRMWRMIGGEMPNELDYYRTRTEPPAGEGWCQPFCDGPENNPDNPVLETYLQIIGQARRMLYLTTPYYAVETSMQEALCIAADAGVDVRLMMPGIPDKKMPYMVAETYWGELLRHGVKIYRYTPGFLHSKSVLADRELALVGSTNMDYRTFQLQYETAVLLYQSPAVEELLEDMDAIMAESQPYTLAEWNRRPWPKRAIAAVLKLFSIWL